MQKSHLNTNRKVSLLKKKTKIYWTIKGLIILFIKLQFFIFSTRYNQAFKPLHTSTSNIYLNLNLNPNSLVISIIPNIFVSSPLCIIIPDVHLQKFLYI